MCDYLLPPLNGGSVTETTQTTVAMNPMIGRATELHNHPIYDCWTYMKQNISKKHCRKNVGEKMIEKKGVTFSKTSPNYIECPQGDIHVISMETMRANNGRHEYFNVPETTHAEMGIMLVMKDRKAYQEAFAHRKQKKNYLMVIKEVVRWLKGH